MALFLLLNPICVILFFSLVAVWLWSEDVLWDWLLTFAFES